MEQNDILTYCGGEDQNSLLTVLNKNNEDDFLIHFYFRTYNANQILQRRRCNYKNNI